jgi:spermidine synthase
MEMGLLFLIMLVPTILMGGVFPLIISITTTAYRTLGRYVGRIYFLNTLGSIAGGSLGSFLLMHHLGVSLSLKTSILVSIGAGVTVLAVQYFSPASRELRNRLRRISTSSGSSVRTYGKTVRLRRQTVRRRTRSASWRTPVVSGTVAAGLIILLLPLGSPLQKLGENERLLFYREAASATVSVREDAEGGRMLSINGLDEVPVDPSSLLTFKVLAHLPLLIHPDPEDVMVVSLGGGITTGSVSTHPVESITAVELVPPVVQAADYFAEWNHQVLAEPRLSVVLQDGRNHMLVSPDQYDVITADATHPWSADSWILYTREFYQLVKSRLAADGIFCQWIPLHWLAEQDFKCILRTMGEIFPDLTLWYTGSYAVVLSGPAEYQVDIQQLEERLNQEKVKNDLSAVGINSPSVLFSLFLLSPEGVGEYTGEGPVNTDNLPILEHSAARCFGIETTPLNLRSLALVREHPERFLSGTSPDPALGTSSEPANPLPGLDQLFDARDLMIQGRIATYEGDFSEAIELYAEAMDRAPRDGVSPLFHQDAVRTHAADTARRGDEFRRMGDLSRARSTYYEALRIDPGQPRAHNGLGMLAYAEGRYGEALDQYARALDRMPYQVQIRHNLVLTLLKLGRVEYAEQEIDAIEELEKDMPGSHVAEVLRGYLAQVRG